MRSVGAGGLVVAAALFSVALPARLAQAQEFTIRLATVAPDNTPWSEAVKRFRKEVEEKSGGRIKVKVFLGGMLGDENETVLKCKRGQIEAVGASTGAIASQVPELNVIEIPYLFRSAAEADQVIDKVLSPEFEKILPRYGFVLGFWSENGFREFGTRDKFVKKPSDLKGKKMRSQENPIHLSMYRAYGASPVPIPTTEGLTALQNKTVDGFDQALLFAIATSWHTAVKFVTISDHIYQPAIIIYNKDWFAKLPPDLQTVVLEAGKSIQVKGRKAVRKIIPDLIALLKEEGVQVYELTVAERKVFEDASLPVRAEFRKTQGKEATRLLDLAEKALKDIRK